MEIFEFRLTTLPGRQLLLWKLILLRAANFDEKLVPFGAADYFAGLYFPIASNILLVIWPTRNKKDALFSRGLGQIGIRGGFVKKTKVIICATPNANQHHADQH